MHRDIAMVLLMAAVAVRGLPEITNPDLCIGIDVGDYRCGSCLQPIRCGASGLITEQNTCPPGTVCEEITRGTVACVPMPSATFCQCTSDICDPYEPSFTAKCDASGVTDIVQCPATGACAGNGNCIDCAEIPGGPVYIFRDPECSSLYSCTNGIYSGVTSCAEGEYVSKDGSCSPAPPTPCAAADRCTGGLCPDLTDCTRYYICDPNQVPPATGPISCPSNQYFNPATLLCESTSVNCDPWTQCDFTTTVPTCPKPEDCNASTVGNSPYGPCDSRYCACREVSSGSYDVVEMECPGDYVFSTNPNYPYCVDPSGEPTCFTHVAEH
ncbi:latent-transforming growth factor beta-binding protein 2 [Hyalella azteca]|uniref:Latent-transforming growth factor beta-binding protein 2 n=1 Tax=Hyalella azteca TaxID=294128 RepID=A0A8B7N3J3_HYAAZ|nr:latent-transforming growth factor beta-binding protein 2 [Hyalella azteca]